MTQKYKNLSKKTEGLSKISLYSLLKLNLNQFRLIAEADVPVHYYRYIPMFEDYMQMIDDGAKKAYVVLYLAEKYNISDSTVKRVIRALETIVDL